VVSNDSAAAALATAALWSMARILRRGLTLKRALLAGALSGLAILAKTSTLPLLPLLGHVARGHPLPPWVDSDPSLGVPRRSDGVLDTQALVAVGGVALTAPAEGLPEAWRAEWQRLWPGGDKALVGGVEGLAASVLRHTRAFAQAGSDTAWSLRRELRERLRMDFHRLGLQPAAGFAFLALVALDLERLRAALMQRALFSLGEAG
jgi:hypothetical protein